MHAENARKFLPGNDYAHYARLELAYARGRKVRRTITFTTDAPRRPRAMAAKKATACKSCSAMVRPPPQVADGGSQDGWASRPAKKRGPGGLPCWELVGTGSEREGLVDP